MTALNIYQRLAAVMAEVTYIQKEKKSGMNYTIVSHDAVTAKVRPALLKHGIVYHPVRCDHQHNGNRAECAMTVRFVNVDEPADFFDVPTFGYGIDPQDKGPGKAMSYAVKYALLKALGLETGDDADMDNIDHSPGDPALPTADELTKDLIAGIARQNTKQHLADYAAAHSADFDRLGKLNQAALAKVRGSYADRMKQVRDDPARQAPHIEGEAA